MGNISGHYYYVTHLAFERCPLVDQCREYKQLYRELLLTVCLTDPNLITVCLVCFVDVLFQTAPACPERLQKY